MTSVEVVRSGWISDLVDILRKWLTRFVQELVWGEEMRRDKDDEKRSSGHSSGMSLEGAGV